MTDPVAVAVIGAIAAVLGGAIGALVTFVTGRQKVRVESISASAAADLNRAQATDLMWENLTEAYKAATAELRSLREEVRQLPALRVEVDELRDQLHRFEQIIDGLPAEYQTLFAPVRRKGRASPKASGPGGGL